MAKTSFAKEMKRHQLSWALSNGVTRDMLETRRGLPEPVGGNEDVNTAFNSIVPDDPVQVVDPGAFVQAIADEDMTWRKWATTMRSRYRL